MQPKDHRGADQFFFDYRATNDSDAGAMASSFSLSHPCNDDSEKGNSIESASSSESASDSDDFDDQQANVRKRLKFMNGGMMQ